MTVYTQSSLIPGSHYLQFLISWQYQIQLVKAWEISSHAMSCRQNIDHRGQVDVSCTNMQELSKCIVLKASKSTSHKCMEISGELITIYNNMFQVIFMVVVTSSCKLLWVHIIP